MCVGDRDPNFRGRSAAEIDGRIDDLASRYAGINRGATTDEYREVVDHARSPGLHRIGIDRP